MSKASLASFSVAGVGTWQSSLPWWTDQDRLTPRQVTDLTALCLARAVEWFIATYFPLRFSRGYAWQELGYEVLGSTIRRKMRAAQNGRPRSDSNLPNVWTGETRTAVLTGSRVETTGFGGAASGIVNARIIIPLPPYINQQRGGITAQTIRKITQREAAAMSKRFFAELEVAFSRLKTENIQTKTGKLRPRVSLSGIDAAEVGRTSRATAISVRSSAVGGAA